MILISKFDTMYSFVAQFKFIPVLYRSQWFIIY